MQRAAHAVLSICGQDWFTRVRCFIYHVSKWLCVCLCVCVSVCARASIMRACTRVFKGASRNTNQQSIKNVIDELWQTTAPQTCTGFTAFVFAYRVRAHVCVSICGWCFIQQMSLPLVTLIWTRRNTDATLNHGLGWLSCNNPDIIKNKGWDMTITTY